MFAPSTFPRLSLAVRSVAAIALIGTAIPAFAQSEDAPTVSVRYSDLNLASKAGVAALHQRIARAADQVCGSADSRDLAANAAINACRQRAVSDATVRADDVAAQMTSRLVATR
jgi:UrcA family protein